VLYNILYYIYYTLHYTLLYNIILIFTIQGVDPVELLHVSERLRENIVQFDQTVSITLFYLTTQAVFHCVVLQGHFKVTATNKEAPMTRSSEMCWNLVHFNKVIVLFSA